MLLSEFVLSSFFCGANGNAPRKQPSSDQKAAKITSGIKLVSGHVSVI